MNLFDKLKRSPQHTAPDIANPLALLRRSEFVTEQWYRLRYRTDIPGTMPADEHYLMSGARRGCDPNPLFRTAWYVKQYPSVLASGLNPAVHYLAVGSANGLRPNAFFDVTWYRATYPDVVAAGIEPIIHYLKFGAREGRNPAADIVTHLLPKEIDPVTGGDANPLATYLDLVELMRRGFQSTSETQPNLSDRNA